jgi:hypothetical protein
MKPFVAKGCSTGWRTAKVSCVTCKGESLVIRNPESHWPLALLAAVTALCLSSAAIAADAPTPTVEHTGNWRTAVHRFVEANMKHPAWGLSHSMRDYELAKQLAAADQVTLDDDVLYAASYCTTWPRSHPSASPACDHQDEAARIVESMLAGTGFPMTRSKRCVVRSARTCSLAIQSGPKPSIFTTPTRSTGSEPSASRGPSASWTQGRRSGWTEAVQDLQHSLETVPPRIVSKAGKALTPQRVRELEQFLQELRAESGT